MQLVCPSYCHSSPSSKLGCYNKRCMDRNDISSGLCADCSSRGVSCCGSTEDGESLQSGWWHLNCARPTRPVCPLFGEAICPHIGDIRHQCPQSEKIDSFRICVREFGGEGSWRDEKPLEDDDHDELYFFTRNDLGILTEVPRFLSQFTSSASAGATGTSHLIAYPHFWCASCERYPYEFTHPDTSPNPKI